MTSWLPSRKGSASEAEGMRPRTSGGPAVGGVRSVRRPLLGPAAGRHPGGVDRAVDAAIEREIPALAEELGVAVVVATRKVARVWFDDALAQGLSLSAADEVSRYVHLVGSGIRRSEPERLRHYPTGHGSPAVLS